MPVRALSACILGLLLLGSVARAGDLRGSVKDSESGQGLIGVDLVLVGTEHKTATDLEGNWELAGVPSGLYELRVTYMGYNTRFLTGIEVPAAGVAELPVTLESFKAYQTDELVVSGSRVLSTEGALLADRQQSGVIGDAISAAQISRTPDGNSGDALKRVPGLTVNDGKYVFVRGVTDRYNVTEVNGISMSGTNVEKDRKSFNFDLVPANLLANVIVIKSATPDMPGDFAGGLVRISTLEFPERATTSVTVGAASTNGTTGEDFQHDSAAGGNDWLGVDDGGRDFPRHLLAGPDSVAVADREQNLARALPNDWTTETRQAPFRYNWGLSHGNRLGLFGGNLGYMAALSYRNDYELRQESENRQSDPVAGGTQLQADGETSHTNVTWGGLANLFYRTGRHRLGLTNTYNRSADTDLTFLQGKDSTKEFAWRSLSWQERYQYVGKLDGSHGLPAPAGEFELAWQGFYGESRATEPDRRFLSYNTGGQEGTPDLMDENMRTWSWLKEFRRGFAVDLTWSLTTDDLLKERTPSFKFGVRQDRRERTFDVEAWFTTPTFRPASRALSVLPPDSIFAPGNYNEVSDSRRGNGWEFDRDAFNSGAYGAYHDLDAWYGMADLPFSLIAEDFRLVGGARVEDSDQLVEAVQSKTRPDVRDTARVDVKDVLPSLNLTWFYDEKVNVRAGYYESVNRPEFRELAPVLRRNFRTFQNELGNPDLKRARIRNYDLRAEYFPGYGEVVAASAFYKRIADAIEDTLYMAPERAVASWSNAPQAKNWGFELEVRKRLEWFTLTEDVTVSANYTRVWSEVEYYDALTRTTGLRTLHGQAPWSVNASLEYNNPNTRTAVNLLYNKVGRKLDKIADFTFLYVYEEPRGKLDLVMTQGFGRGVTAKVAVKDILAQDTIMTSGSAGNPYEYSRITEGRDYSVSVSTKF